MIAKFKHEPPNLPSLEGLEESIEETFATIFRQTNDNLQTLIKETFSKEIDLKAANSLLEDFSQSIYWIETADPLLS